MVASLRLILFLFCIACAPLAAHSDKVVTALHKAERYAREALDNEALSALTTAYQQLKNEAPDDPLLPVLQDRLQRYNAASSMPSSYTTSDDLAYRAIETLWHEGHFWQASFKLNAFVESLHGDMQSASLAAQCAYLQAEMEFAQGSFLSAHRAYKRACSFPYSAHAPWIDDAVMKSNDCLSLSTKPDQSFDARLSLPTAYGAQSRQWQKVQEIIRSSGNTSQAAVDALLQYIQAFDDGLYLADGLYQLMDFSLEQSDIEKATLWKKRLEERCPSSPLCAKAYVCFARYLESQGDFVSACHEYRKGARAFPESPFAAECAFFSYPYQDYVEGKQEALRHLLDFETKFAFSHYALFSRYVRALNQLYPQKGKKVNPLSALNILQELVEHATKMQNSGNVSAEDEKEVTLLVMRALYAQTAAHRLMADEAKETKKQLFLSLCKAGLEQLITRLAKDDTYTLLQREAQVALMQCYIGLGEQSKAHALGKQLLTQLRSDNPLHHKLLAHVYCALGAYCTRLNEYKEALLFLKQAERFASSMVLSADERFDLFFLQAQNYIRCGEMDLALKALSNIINDESVSHKRFEALYQRAEIFCQQGRLDLAQRQWQALLGVESSVSEKAKQRLEETGGLKT